MGRSFLLIPRKIFKTYLGAAFIEFFFFFWSLDVKDYSLRWRVFIFLFFRLLGFRVLQLPRFPRCRRRRFGSAQESSSRGLVFWFYINVFFFLLPTISFVFFWPPGSFGILDNLSLFFVDTVNRLGELVDDLEDETPATNVICREMLLACNSLCSPLVVKPLFESGCLCCPELLWVCSLLIFRQWTYCR